MLPPAAGALAATRKGSGDGGLRRVWSHGIAFERDERKRRHGLLDLILFDFDFVGFCLIVSATTWMGW